MAGVLLLSAALLLSTLAALLVLLALVFVRVTHRHDSYARYRA